MTTFAIVLTVTVILGIFSINRLSSVNDGVVTVSKNYLVASNELGAFESGLAARLVFAMPPKQCRTALKF